MLLRLSRVKRLMLAFIFGLFALVAMLMTSYERLLIGIANHYLVEYNTQIDELSIKPTFSRHWLFPSIKLTVHHSEISITDLALTLDRNMGLLSLYDQRLFTDQVMGMIEKVTVKNIDAKLNPGVLTQEGKNVDQQGPTLALDLGKLPHIDIGTTSLSLVGIPASTLSLSIAHLTLDEEGNLSSAIHRDGNAMFELDAQLTEKRWQVSSRLVFDELYTFLSELAAQDLDTSALTPLLAVKQESERLGLAISGTLRSKARLDLESAQLESSHQLTHASLTLTRLNDLTFTPHSLSPSPEDNSARDRLKFEIAGHLGDLHLTIQPFTLELSPNSLQISRLLARIEDKKLTSLMATLLAPRASAAEWDKNGWSLQDKNPTIKASVALFTPVEYAFVSKKLHLGHAQLLVRDALVDASLSATDLSLQIPTQTRAFTLDSDWQFAASREQALALSSLVTHAPSYFPTSFADNKAIADILLGASSLSLAGQINIAMPSASESPRFRLSIKPQLQAQIDSLELVPNPVKQNAARPLADNTKIHFELKRVKLVSQDRLVITSNDTSPLSIDIPGLTVTAGTSHYRRDVQAHLASATKDIFSLEANNLRFSTAAMSHFFVTNTHNDEHRIEEPPINGSLVNESLSNNRDAATDSKFTLSAFTLESEEIKLIQSTSSGASLTVSTAMMRLTSLDDMVINRMTRASSHGERPIELILPPLNLEQRDNRLVFNPMSSAEPNDYLATISGLHLSLEHPTSLSIDSLTSADMSQVLAENLWQNLVHYELDDAKLTHDYIKNNRRGTETLLTVYTGSLSQTLDWNGVNLNTHENWQFDDLEFVSEHSLRHQRPTAVKGAQLKLTGKLTLASKLGNILALLSDNYFQPTSLFITGDTRLQAEYALNSYDDLTQMSINFEPEFIALSGSINELPFEQADILASCHYRMERLNRPSSHEPLRTKINTLACPEIQFSAAAFNPGILLTNLKAQADFSLSLDDNDSSINGLHSVPAAIKSADSDVNKRQPPEFLDTLSAANIQINASGDLLGGHLLLPEFNLRLDDKSHGYLVLQGIEIEQVLAIHPQVGLYADGVFDGVLPVELVDGKISVSGGRLAARAPGGLIAISGNPSVEQMRLSQPYLDFAFSTMEHLAYSELASSFDMAPNGDAQLKVTVKGKAKGFERPIHLNYSQEENMLQLLKSLQIGGKLQTQIEQSMN